MEYTFYKFSNNGEPEWIEVTDIGQHVLFLGGYDHDHDAVAFSIANLQLLEWGAKCLCYDAVMPEEWYPVSCRASLYNHKIKLGSLNDGTVTDITCDLGSFQTTRQWQFLVDTKSALGASIYMRNRLLWALRQFWV
jgi:hypothetical protein